MGRGLSELQKTILAIALKNKGNTRDRYPHPDVCDNEVYYAYWKWQPTFFHYGDLPNTFDTVEDALRCYVGNVFSKADVGEEEYNAAHAALSRALRRLEKRGLVTMATWGANLTEEGVAVAESLSVKPRENCPQA